MGTGQKRNVLLVPQSQRGMYNFKYEVARDLNIQPPEGDYWGEVPARDCGAVGGHMVRRMIQLAEQQLAGGTSGFTGGTGGFTGGMTSMTGGTSGFTGTTQSTSTTTAGRAISQNPSSTPRSLGTNRTSR
ncbi:MAG: small, acid-soluble spore protein, alpha/beta type [Chloroflexota bacterium]